MSVRFLLRDLALNRLRNAWTRNINVGSVVKRYRRDRSVREVFLCFRQAFFRPRGTLLISATAACQAKDDEETVTELPLCIVDITDEELQDMLSAFDGIQALSETIFCPTCHKRVVIDKRHSGVKYCTCKEPSLPTISKDGWEPYVEADDTIIWRKEYKVGQGLYAYKVYGRYKDVLASHYAAVNVDTAYRRQWDAAVADLSIVEHSRTKPDQAVIHWEVLWPRLFANRDYVYIRRHKEYTVDSRHHDPFQERTEGTPTDVSETAGPDNESTESGSDAERPSVHSNAKRKSLETYRKMPKDRALKKNKVYVILSKSCSHPGVPETKNAIRVTEYWSRMVVRSTDGADNSGMEFVLTYYDEPAVGGLPSGVASWASGRAAPAYLDKMRDAAKQYEGYRRQSGPTDDLAEGQPIPETISYKSPAPIPVNERDMESSKQGPELENGLNNEQSEEDQSLPTKEQSLPNKDQSLPTKSQEGKGPLTEEQTSSNKDQVLPIKEQSLPKESKCERVEESEENKNEGTQTELFPSAVNTEAQTKAQTETQDSELDEKTEETKSIWRYPFYFFS